MQVGEYTYGQENIQVRGVMNDVIIGKYCSIAANCVIDGGFNHNTKFISTFPFFNKYGKGNQNIITKGDVIIGNDVWIGENVIIMSGVRINDGAVIGANSLVTKDMPAYSVCVGTPCEPIKTRFTISEILRLLEIKWWNWPHDKVEAHAHLLSSEDINTFINKALCERQ